MKKSRILLLSALWLFTACVPKTRPAGPGGMEYAQWFDVQGNQVIIHSPYGAAPDTLTVDAPLHSIVCMSSSYIGFLDALGCDSVVTAVSGLDYVQDPEVLEQAVQLHADIIVTHHPAIFRGIKQLTDADWRTALLLEAARHDIAVYSAHTNLDSVTGGVNDVLANLLELENVEGLSGEDTLEGIGRIGTLPKTAEHLI